MEEENIEQATVPTDNVETYRQDFNKQLKLKTIFSLVVLAASLVLLFVPIFTINLDSLSNADLEIVYSLPGVEEAIYEYFIDALEGEEVGDCIFTFSFYDEAKYFLDNHSAFAYYDTLSTVSSVLLFGVFLFGICAAVCSVISLFVYIPALLKKNDYAQKQYDNIQKEIADDSDESMGFLKNIPMYFLNCILYNELFILAFICAVVAYFLCGSASAVVQSGNADVATGYMYYMTGINFFTAVAALLSIIAVVMFFMIVKKDKAIKKQIKTQSKTN